MDYIFMNLWKYDEYYIYRSITCCANLKLLNTPTKPDMIVSLILHVYRAYIWYLFQQQKVRIKFQLTEIWANHANRIKLHKNGPATCLLLSIQEPEFAMPIVIRCSFPPYSTPILLTQARQVDSLGTTVTYRSNQSQK